LRNGRIGDLQLLAFQVGSEVSLDELASRLSVDAKTVQRYLDLLEKAFVIIRVGGFSRLTWSRSAKAGCTATSVSGHL